MNRGFSCMCYLRPSVKRLKWGTRAKYNAWYFYLFIFYLLYCSPLQSLVNLTHNANTGCSERERERDRTSHSDNAGVSDEYFLASSYCILSGIHVLLSMLMTFLLLRFIVHTECHFPHYKPDSYVPGCWNTFCCCAKILVTATVPMFT